MGSHSSKCFQLALVGVLFSSILAPAIAERKPHCPDSCGNVSIPFPFGVAEGCYLNSDFNITCNYSYNPPKTFLRVSKFEITEIRIDGQLSILRPVARDCNSPNSGYGEWNHWFNLKKFTVSKSKNKFTVVGCNSYAYLQGNRSDGKTYSAGCMSLCDQRDYVDDNSCSGSGCCQIEIPYGLYLTNVSAYLFKNTDRNVSDFSPCTYAFIVEQTKFNFSPSYLKNLLDDAEFPVVLDWSLDDNITVEACKGNATSDTQNDVLGFRCKCLPGYEGNPYLGCLDIDECSDNLHTCTHLCTNIIGNYTCSCPRWYKGDGRKNGQGCILHPLPIIFICLCAGVTIILAFVASSWFYLVLRQRKLKERLFRENGGYILQQKLFGQERSPNNFRIFTAEQLESATDNYDERMIIGKGGFGTVYKGILSNRTEVAIKKSTSVDHSQVDQFVNEVFVLSQINHRNVVRLIGCCLETQVPLLVYEFITNGTLYEHIHKSLPFPWEIRLKVAAETAEALNYLHFGVSVPIIHRDVKTTNILLTSSCTAKVSDFGASRFINPLDENQLSTVVQGTWGYLDPEYLQTSHLTDKSDVYSFGVVLVELLTGLKPLSFERPEAQRSLAMHFVLSVKHDYLFDIVDSELINRGNEEQLKEMALLAKRCLALKGEERPSMKEIAMELEGMLKMVKHPWDQVNLEEEEYLLMEHSKTYGDGGSASTVGYDSLKNEVISSIGGGR